MKSFGFAHYQTIEVMRKGQVTGYHHRWMTTGGYAKGCGFGTINAVNTAIAKNARRFRARFPELIQVTHRHAVRRH